MPDSSANSLVSLEEGQKPVGLKRWERHFARWLANQFGRTVGRAEMVEAATKFANKPVSWSKLRTTLRNPAWKTLHNHLSGDITERVLAKAKARMLRSSRYSAEAYELAMKRIVEGLKDGSADADYLSVIRAGSPLISAGMDRLYPKKQETEVNQNIQITLTTNQLQGLSSMPVLTVEAEDIEIEPAPEELPERASA